jgi:hypothetical protein
MKQSERFVSIFMAVAALIGIAFGILMLSDIAFDWIPPARSDPLEQGPAHADNMPKQLACAGTLAIVNGDLQLEPDPGAALWCGASFEGEKYQVVKPGITKQILTACDIGSRCHVTGIVNGHGQFYWIKIKRAKKEDRDK